MRYRFERVEACNMCRHEGARVLGRRLSVHQGLRARKSIGIATTVVACGGCGLIYSNPRPVPETLEQHYDRLPEEYWRSEYFDEAAGYFETEAKRFRSLWVGDGTPRALDIGAGIGKAMRALAHDGFDTFGLEPSPSFRDRALDSGVDADRLQLASIETAQFKPYSFDFISFGAVLEHLHDPAGGIERALSWAAPGALIHVEVPSAKWLVARMINGVYRAQGVDYVTHLSPMHPPFHLYEFTTKAFELHGTRAGYELADHRFYACEAILPRPARRISAAIMNSTNTGMQLEVWLRKSGARSTV